ncbi:MAG: tail protein X [Oscillospiraceae bacterium]|nr:tail protein X [Oscillospiraceae bacterium]
MKTYTTKQGDMWDGIAYTEMGSTDHTGTLMQSNLRHVHYYTFPAGIVLNIPDIGEDESDVLPPWKKVAG